MLENLIRGGLAYERGELNAAYEYALSATACLKDSFAPEMQFCAYMLLATVLTAQENSTDAQKTLSDAEAMIERHKAYYLSANFRAFTCRLKMADGDTEAARNWLKQNECRHDDPSFFGLYRHFTSARAYLVTGDYNAAILFLKKLLALCEQYRRTLGGTEANILLAIAYWNKVRGTQNAAFEPLEKAILAAREFGYTQAFASPDLANMLHKLHKQVIQKDYYSGPLSSAEVKTLYYAAIAKAKHSPGLTGGRALQNLKFTSKQKTVMRYLADGLTQKEIAAKMGLQPSSVKVHVALIYKKLKVSNVADAIIKIRETEGILS
jgi:LuxR family maltose regulon positive regulatory protein